MGDKNLLKEAIADAKLVREMALENARLALEEAFTPKLKSMFSDQVQNELEEELDSSGIGDSDNKEPSAVASDDSTEDEEGPSGQSGEPRHAADEDEDFVPDSYGVEESVSLEEMEDEEEMDYDADEEEMGDEDEEDYEEEDSLDLESIIRELEEDEFEDEDEEETDYDATMDYDADEEEMGDEDEEVDIEIEPEETEEEDEMDFEEEDEDEEELDLESLMASFNEECGDCDIQIENERLQEELEAKEGTLKEYKKVIKFLRSKLSEVNVLNARLLYTNRLFKNFEMDNANKVKVLENFDRARNIREIKLVFATLAENLAGERKSLPDSSQNKVLRRITEGASKKVRSTRHKKDTKDDGSSKIVARNQKLAGIKK